MPSGLMLGRYNIIRVLGRGTMGEVLEVCDNQTQDHYALKRIPAELSHSPAKMRALRANFSLVSKLTHPHIATTRFLEVDSESGEVYIIMDLVRGCDLGFWLVEERDRQGGLDAPLPMELVLGIAEQIATALDYAHSQPVSYSEEGKPKSFGVLHRDLKPENIMVETGRQYRPGVPYLKIVDFGIAAQIQTNVNSQTQYQSGVNAVAGTPLYMSPEQWQGRRLSRAIDQWALAVIIYELAEGRPPFTGLSPADLRDQVCNAEPCPAEILSSGQWTALAKAFHRDRTQRYPSATALVKALANSHRSTRNTIQLVDPTLPEDIAVSGPEVASPSAKKGTLASAEATSAANRAESNAADTLPKSSLQTLKVDSPRLRTDQRSKGFNQLGKMTLVVALLWMTIVGLYFLFWDQNQPSKKTLQSLTVEMVPDQKLTAGDKIQVQISAADPNVPPSLLRYELTGTPPAGALVDQKTGMVSWATTLETKPGDYKFAVRITSTNGEKTVEFTVAVSASTKSSNPIATLLRSRTTDMEMVLIKAGDYTMGSPWNQADRSSDEKEHRVTLSRNFYLGKYEVTQKEFERVLGFNPSKYKGSQRLPVEGVTWFDAVMYCNKLSELDGYKESYRISNIVKDGDHISAAQVELIAGASGYRLPTEAEWEYACRAGSKTAYSFGDDAKSLGDYAWFGENSNGQTHPVGEKKPNAWGLHDMHGNVWEWCNDWYGDSEEAVTDPTGPQEGSNRVFRGGSWYYVAALCRSADRNWNVPSGRLGYDGFRVALSFPSGIPKPLQSLTVEMVPDQKLTAGDKIQVQISAADPNVPPSRLRYELTGTPPAGALVDEKTGMVSWATTLETKPGDYKFAVRITSTNGEKTVEFTVAVSASTKSSNPIATLLSSRTTDMEMVLIKAGDYTMGSPVNQADRSSDESEHRVTLSRNFYLGKYEVTQEEFERVLGFNPSEYKDSQRLPVEGVTWFDAVMYCNKLSELDGYKESYRISNIVKDGDHISAAQVELIAGASGYRLPTEAEWEYACRAGSKTAYSFGDDAKSLGDYAWFGENSNGQTHPVGEKKPNAWGLHDMHGNVWEWCNDWYGDSEEAVTDPTGPQEGSGRVSRGGSWLGGAAVCRSAFRVRDYPSRRIISGGFRVALSFPSGIPK